MPTRVKIDMKYLFISSMILFACTFKKVTQNDIEYIKQQSWLYESGAKLGTGDWMDFDDTTYYSVKGDTIFKESKPLGRIQNINKTSFSLKIFSFKDNSNGIYVSSAER
jgi:hypothetical protein